jgi:RNA polymerase sigma factor (sigma-70 family)
LDKADWISILMQRHSKGLIRYAANILHDKEAAKEIVQDCFLKLLQQAPEVPREQTQAWLWRECRNRSIDAWRKLRKIDHLEDKGEEVFGSSDSNPLQELETQRDLKAMQATLRHLSSVQQEALFLKYKDGLSYKEIAEVMGLSATNVGFILHEAMSLLRSATDGAAPAVQVRKYGE